MRKKCAILTLNTKNYGGVLQMYALQKTIASFDYECVTLKVRTKPRKKKFFKSILTFIYQKIVIKILSDKLRKKRTSLFLKKLKMTDQLNETQAVKYIFQNNFDSVVVGSDQVWNDKMFNNSDFFFWPYEKKFNLISYAASFGYSLEKYKPKHNHIENIKKFNFISIREEDGVAFLKNQELLNVEKVLDPTLLIEKNHWNELAQSSDLNHFVKRNKYGLVYLMSGDKITEKFIYNVANKISNEENIDFYVIGLKEIEKLKNNPHALFGAGPLEWLDLIANAEWVITNSYHGTIFSLIFEKKFASIVNSSSSVNYPIRIISLLESIGRKDIIYDVSSNIPFSFSHEENNFDEKIKAYKRLSYEWLRKALKNE